MKNKKRRGGTRRAAVMSPESFKRIRETLGLSQSAMGDRLGVAELTIHFWETGKTPISKSRAMAVQALAAQAA